MFFIPKIADHFEYKTTMYVKDLKVNQTKANISQGLVLFVHMEINRTCTLIISFIYLKISMTIFEIHILPAEEEKTESHEGRIVEGRL